MSAELLSCVSLYQMKKKACWKRSNTDGMQTEKNNSPRNILIFPAVLKYNKFYLYSYWILLYLYYIVIIWNGLFNAVWFDTLQNKIHHSNIKGESKRYENIYNGLGHLMAIVGWLYNDGHKIDFVNGNLVLEHKSFHHQNDTDHHSRSEYEERILELP